RGDLAVYRVEIRLRAALVRDDPCPSVGDGVELLAPALDLVLALVLPRVAVVVALVAVRVGDDECRPLAGPRARHRFAGGRVDRTDVTPVDMYSRHPVALGSLRDVVDSERALHREALGVLVVLADIDGRQLPYRGEVQRLMKRTLVDRAVAEERDRDLVGAELLGGERSARRDGDPAADDPVRAEVALRRVRDVHRAAPAAAVPRFPAEKLGEHLAEVCALRDAVPVTTMRGGDPVVVVKVGAHAGGDRLLSGVAVDRPPDLVLAEELCCALLERADRPHDAIEVHGRCLVHPLPSAGWSITRIAPPRRTVKVPQATAHKQSGK